MSVTTDAEQTAIRNRVDPTQTYSIRTGLGGRIRGAYGAINSELETAVVTRDAFGTRTDTEQLADLPRDENAGANYDPEALPALTYLATSEQVRRFREWLDRQQEQGVRGQLTRTTNPWLTRAYNSGVRTAEQSLRDAGYTVNPTDPENVPRRGTTLDEARSRFTDRITAAINDTTAETGQALQEGLEKGLAATALYNALRDRINHSRAGKTRARPVAHGEIVRTANTGTLDRLEAAGVEEVGAKVEVQVEGPIEGTPEGVDPGDVESPKESRGEWVTAGDLKVCPQCLTLEGQTWRISDIRAGRSPMPVRDTHPSCRCQIVAT